MGGEDEQKEFIDAGVPETIFGGKIAEFCANYTKDWRSQGLELVVFYALNEKLFPLESEVESARKGLEFLLDGPQDYVPKLWHYILHINSGLSAIEKVNACELADKDIERLRRVSYYALLEMFNV